MKKILMILAVGLMSIPMFGQTADADEVLRRAEKMPIFQDCEDQRFTDYPYRCTIKQLMDYFQENVVVEIAEGGQTKALLSFVVEKNGSTSEIELQRGTIVKNANGEEDKAVQDALDAAIVAKAQQLSFKSAGEEDGEAVRVKLQFSVPISF